jgi:hypothetical protein
VGTGAVGFYPQEYGSSVSISGDGATALVGGQEDDDHGATWVFTRAGSTWAQQGSKLVGSGSIGNAEQGHSASISFDGNYAIIGGPDDNYERGAAWIFMRTGSSWAQQGSKLVGSPGGSDGSSQGISVSINGDGALAVVGGPSDNSLDGAVWVFKRTGTTWAQEGDLMTGTGSAKYQLGKGVAMSGDGTYVLAGGSYGNAQEGAAWMFDFNTQGPSAAPTPPTAPTVPTASPIVTSSALGGGAGQAVAVLVLLTGWVFC